MQSVCICVILHVDGLSVNTLLGTYTKRKHLRTCGGRGVNMCSSFVYVLY